MKFHKNKFLSTVAAAALVLAVGACSSSGDDDGITAERDDALAALAAAKTAAAAAATAAEEAQAAALAAAALAAEAAQMTALADAATAAAAAQEMALAEAATAAEAAKMMALADAATAAEAVKMMALADAATAAEAAKMMALADAATAAEAAKAMALAEAATAAEAALETALADAATLAGEDKAEAVRLAEEAHMTALAAAKTAADDAQAMALAAAKTAADDAQAMALAAAKTAADDAQAMALAAAKTAADDAQAMALAAAKTAADAKLMAANNGLVAALQELNLDPASDTMSVEYQIAANTTTLKDALAKIREEARTALTEAARKEKIAREVAVNTAIGANRVGDSANVFPTGITVQAVTRNAAGMVTVDVNGAADDVYAGGETTAGSGDWNSVTLTKTDAGTEATDTVVFYTDIEAPSDKLLTAQYEQTELDDALNADRVEKAASAGFPSASDTDWEYTGETDGRAKTVTGTFDGVPGQFTCTADACTVMTDDKGKLIASEGWRFTPVSPLTATVKDPDVAYAYFGWWLNKPKANVDEHDVEVFAGGTAEHEAEVNEAIEGTATYAGPAAGKYVTKTFSAGVHSDSGVGHFTAKASLTAKFGAATGLVGTIGGSVTGFVLDDTTAASWKVTLEDATLQGGDATFNGLSEVDFGGGATTNDAGTWQGSFYGAGATDADAPDTVTGTFDALTDNASVIGGFGATKQ